MGALDPIEAAAAAAGESSTATWTGVAEVLDVLDWELIGLEPVKRRIRETASNPGFRSRITDHIDFPDYEDGEPLIIGEKMLARQNFQIDDPARAAFAEYIPLRRTQPRFANARSIRNALDRMRLRLASRVFCAEPLMSREDLKTIREEDVRASLVYKGLWPATLRPRRPCEP